jgi:hypothetical protein
MRIFGSSTRLFSIIYEQRKTCPQLQSEVSWLVWYHLLFVHNISQNCILRSNLTLFHLRALSK